MYSTRVLSQSSISELTKGRTPIKQRMCDFVDRLVYTPTKIEVLDPRIGEKLLAVTERNRPNANHKSL